jgi:hypothetical protein
VESRYVKNFGVETPWEKKGPFRIMRENKGEGVEVDHRDSDSNYST